MGGQWCGCLCVSQTFANPNKLSKFSDLDIPALQTSASRPRADRLVHGSKGEILPRCGPESPEWQCSQQLQHYSGKRSLQTRRPCYLNQ